jgi:hypothetical protein
MIVYNTISRNTHTWNRAPLAAALDYDFSQIGNLLSQTEIEESAVVLSEICTSAALRLMATFVTGVLFAGAGFSSKA